MLHSKSSLTLTAVLLASPVILAGQAAVLIPDSAQRAQARALCGPLREDSLVLDPFWPPAGALVSLQFSRLEPPRLRSARVPSVEYPAELRKLGIQGTVFVAAIVDTTGRIEPASVRVVSTPHEEFIPTARQYLGRLRYSPGHVQDRPMRVCIGVLIPFVLPER
jgi:TonB family protein